MKKLYQLVFVVIIAVALAAGAVHSRLEKQRMLGEIRVRLQSLSLGLGGMISQDLAANRPRQVARSLARFHDSLRDSAAQAVVCVDAQAVAIEGFQSSLATTVGLDSFCSAKAAAGENVMRIDQVDYLAHIQPIAGANGTKTSSLVVAHPLTILRAEVKSAFLRAMGISLGVGALVFALFYFGTFWLLRRSMQYLIRWVRVLFAHARVPHALKLKEVDKRLPAEFRELTRELSSLALKMRHDRAASVSQSKLSLVWNSDLAAKVQAVLKGRQLIIVANREPYSHRRGKDGKVSVVRPASGVVTALEPIMRVCGGGIWVGHGSGDADREVVDSNDEVAVPPESPTYKLRRVWLTEEEENGYYYGFANEGLWPLCHLAHTRPTFRLSDWEMYKSVNKKFAETTLRKTDMNNSVILVQDYHYALLPQMLRERAPGASIELFWHIPWPNPEAFGICPQYKELLLGMLGADVIGFHTQFHCNNFLETCDRFLECRVDWERFSVNVGNHETLIRSYPISIATEPVHRITEDERRELRARYGIRAPMVALGVDRLDYTKGLVERVNGVERFLEKYPQYIGKFSFVEMGTPSRTSILSYKNLIDEVESSIHRVNARFGVQDGYQPIVLLKGHYDWKEVAEFYQLGQVCLVTSLHDGMNLVAKEYVWSQNPEDGALVLSRFTGAAREMSDAIIVNPYSSEEIADALYEALNWSSDERRARMDRMKEKLKNHNAFHWATDLLAGVNAKA